MSLMTEILVGRIKDSPVEVITFVLFDSAPMHPADSVRRYQK